MPVLVAENITKKFAGITALDSVNIELQEGKVTAIIGENGAGKSTLMKILSGVYSEYEGRILFKGECVNFDNPREAQQTGIAIIHQELNLVQQDDTTKCMVWSEHIFVMIMTFEKFKTFVTKPIADTKNNTAALFALSVESLDKINELAGKALAAGGIEPVPFADYGFMQKRNIEDMDGHIWEIFYMDMSKFPAGQ